MQLELEVETVGRQEELFQLFQDRSHQFEENESFVHVERQKFVVRSLLNCFQQFYYLRSQLALVHFHDESYEALYDRILYLVNFKHVRTFCSLLVEVRELQSRTEELAKGFMVLFAKL